MTLRTNTILFHENPCHLLSRPAGIRRQCCFRRARGVADRVLQAGGIDPFSSAPKPAGVAQQPVEPAEPITDLPALTTLTKTNAADLAWDALVKLSEPTAPPEEWQTKRPDEAEIAKFREAEAKRMGVTAERAKDFYTKFPKHEQVAEAKEMEMNCCARRCAWGRRTTWPASRRSRPTC